MRSELLPSTPPKTLTVIGAGKAGASVAAALSVGGWRVSLLCRSESRRKVLQRWYADNSLPVRLFSDVDGISVDVAVLFATSDRDLAHAASQIARLGRSPTAPWLHLSGVAPPSVLDVSGGSATTGSCHPLCAILGPNNGELSLAEVVAPLRGALFALAGTASALELGRAIAETCGGRPAEVAVDARAGYHAAASVVANDLVALLAIGEQLCATVGLASGTSRRALLHLASTSLTALSIAATGPEKTLADGLTGAVGRGDAATLKAHFEALSRTPDAQQAHALLSRQLLELVATRLQPSQHAAVTDVVDAVLAANESSR